MLLCKINAIIIKDTFWVGDKQMKKIYIAGYDVFYDNAKEIGDLYKEICKNNGFEGLYPLDNQCNNATEIFNSNIYLINNADFVVANLNNFRGLDMDSGTAFELGYAYAKGKKIYGYTKDIRSLREKIGEKDPAGFTVEDFKLPVNLMIGVPAVIVEGGFEDCVKAID